MRTFLLILSGMILMYILLKILSKSTEGSSDQWTQIKKLIATQQAKNLIATNEFRELIKTREFENVALSLAKDQINTISNALLNQDFKF